VSPPSTLRVLAQMWHELTSCASCTPDGPPPSTAVHRGLGIWGQMFGPMRPRPAAVRSGLAPRLARCGVSRPRPRAV
jgi:hypothetical protein